MENLPVESTEKEKEFLDMIFALESEKQSLIEESRTRLSQMRKDVEDTHSENEKLKRRVTQLEQQLAQSAAFGGSGPKNREEQEDLLIKAKSLLFEKTKVCKQQESRISALQAQVESLKTVVEVTKDMVNLKTAEMTHMEARWESINLRAKAEKDKCTIFEKKFIIAQGVYDKLRSEYDTQRKIFKDLKESYELKIGVLNKALEAAKQ
ncbi:hypothetical protein ACFFRR_001632 [Megaselia abdita]